MLVGGDLQQVLLDVLDDGLPGNVKYIRLFL